MKKKPLTAVNEKIVEQKEQSFVIGSAEITRATEILQRYKAGKVNLENRIIENEQWYKMLHWDQIRETSKKKGDPEPASAWLFNSIANKHADAMDNYPEPNVLPREANDKADAAKLSKILPVILEHNEFEQTYSDAWWKKLKAGTSIYGIFWNNKLEDGLGDIDVKEMDVLNCFWEPGIRDIQKSRNFFTVELCDNDLLIQQYPQLKNRLTSPTIDVAKYIYDDAVDTTEKSAVVDWYYKQTIQYEINGQNINREILQYCKYVNGEVIYASENDPMYARRGYYDHSKYPFVFDVLFVEEGTPCGFGYVDVMRDPQMYIDKLNQIIIKNAYDLGNPRWFEKDGIGINEEEFEDPTRKFVHFTGRLDDESFKQIEVKPIDASVVQHLNSKIEELKETSGNRDFSQGGTTSGVTAASAIAALQEAGSKLSRDMIKSSYRAYAKINYLCLELIRQFYSEPRSFRVTGEKGETDFTSYDNRGIVPQSQGQVPGGVDLGFRRPVFDIKITSQKSSPFSKIANNELAKELYNLGAFNPQYADQALAMLDMMDFEGKELITQKISQNSMMAKAMQLLLPMAQQLDLITGSQYTPAVMQILGMQIGAPAMQQAGTGGVVQTNPLGMAVLSSQNNTAIKAQERATNVAKPR